MKVAASVSPRSNGSLKGISFSIYARLTHHGYALLFVATAAVHQARNEDELHQTDKF